MIKITRFLSIFLFVLIILFSSVYALSANSKTGSASSVNYQYSPSRLSYSASDYNTYWPILNDADSCKNRQDILLKVAPVGCQPVVVRSDLLAEQNVPVFCQIEALEINPLITIDKIKNIRFSGSYPNEVVGTGFYPAQTAIKSTDKLLGNPGLTNLGYVVVVLKKNEIEKDLPEFINLTMTAKLDYDAGNTFGVGRSEFILEPVSDDSIWENLPSGNRNSFFQGRYFLRLERADKDSAVISVYEHDKKIKSLTVRKGQLSSEIYLPGSYCQSVLQVSYDGFLGNKDRARIQVSDGQGVDTIDVYEGSRILGGSCVVRSINVGDELKDTDDSSSIGTGELVLSCQGQKNSITLSRKTILKDSNGDIQIEDKAINNPQKNDYTSVLQSYVDISEDYTYESEKDAEGSRIYGQDALLKAIDFAELNKQQKTRAELLNSFIEKYPDYSAEKEDELASLYQIDSSKSSSSIKVDGEYWTINVLNFYPKKSESNASFVVEGNLQVNELKVGGTIVTDNGKSLIKISDIEEDRVRISNPGCENKENVEYIGLNERAKVCGYDIFVKDINFESIAKVSIVPRTKNVGTTTNFSIGIGIEKRAIQLSPEKTSEMIENLNASIDKWEGISENLGNVVSGMKAACFATTAALTVKNFFEGIDGKSLAREQAMSGDNGWKEKCAKSISSGKLNDESVSYSSVTACLNDNAAEINKEIEDRVSIINKLNSEAVSVVDSVEVIDEKSALEKQTENFLSKHNDYGDIIKSIPIGGDEVLGYSASDLRDLEYNIELNNKGYAFAQENINAIREKIKTRNSAIEEAAKSKSSGGLGYTAESVDQNSRTLLAVVHKLDDGFKGKVGGNNFDPNSETHAVFLKTLIVSSDNGAKPDGKTYLITGRYGSGRFEASKIYTYTEKDGKGSISDSELEVNGVLALNNIGNIKDKGSLFGNQIIESDRKVRYFANGLDKGMPAFVPFDVLNGWYARIDSSFGFGENAGVYQSSGIPKSWKICNVGDDGAIDSEDQCQRVDGSLPGSGTILSLDKSKSEELLKESSQAILDAIKQKNQKKVNINGVSMDSDLSSADSQTMCQDFMSVEDCKLLFNLCDPVICPNSRCDLGGTYKVADVVQSGIVGSVLLCLPNIKEGIYIPVCLTGIKAGIDGFVSILKSHRDCLQESLDTGKTVGICDQIYSVYMCEFFWRQVAPIADLVIPKLLEGLFGQGARGGGEYLTVMSAWENTQKSVEYFTQSYAANSLKAFNVRNVQEVGTQICKGFVSAKAPTSFESLIEPDSPPQFHAYFDQIPFSDATVPPTSQYKVFYHIFAGNDVGVSYNVYLKGADESVFYSVPNTIQVDTGFVKRGESKTETKDFTAPSGYKELCVRVNNQEECGFKEVSTSFAVDYLTDKVVASDISKSDIKTEQECISGSANLGSLISNPNVQSGVEETLIPNVEERGISRVCASINPALKTEPDRYVEVGYCGSESLKCWLDKTSVNTAISEENIAVQGELNDKIEEIQNSKFNELGLLSKDEDINAELTRIEASGASYDEKLNSLNLLFDKTIYNHHKAKVLFVRAKVLELKYREAYADRLANFVEDGGVSNQEGGAEDNDNGQSLTATSNNEDEPEYLNSIILSRYDLRVVNGLIFFEDSEQTYGLLMIGEILNDKISFFENDAEVNYLLNENPDLDSLSGKLYFSQFPLLDLEENTKNTLLTNPDEKTPKISGSLSNSIEESLTNPQIQVNDPDKVLRTFKWEYKGNDYSLDLYLSKKTYEFYKNFERVKDPKDYDVYVSQLNSEKFVAQLYLILKEYAKNKGITERYDLRNFIISFVQYIDYQSDSDFCGIEAYPKFPYETLYDFNGDCEDTAILMSALLSQAGHKSVLIFYPGHMLSGVECLNNDFESKSIFYTYNEIKYCVLESTGIGWAVGQLDPEYVRDAFILELLPRPVLSVSFKSEYNWMSNSNEPASISIEVTTRNLGTKDASNIEVYGSLDAYPETSGMSWSSDTFIIPKLGIGESNKKIIVLEFPTNKNFRISVIAYSKDNSFKLSNKALSDWAL